MFCQFKKIFSPSRKIFLKLFKRAISAIEPTIVNSNNGRYDWYDNRDKKG